MRILGMLLVSIVAAGWCLEASAVPIAPTITYADQWIGVSGKSRTSPVEVTYTAIDSVVIPSPNSPVAGVSTSVSATYTGNGFVLPLDFIGPGSGGGGFPNEYTAFIGAYPSLDPWIITATTTDASGTSDPVTRTTNAVSATSLVPTATNVTITGNGLSPTIAWTVPGNPNITSARIDLLRITSEDPYQVKLVYAQNLALSTTEVSIPAEFGSNAISDGVNPPDTGLIDGAKYTARVVLSNFDSGFLQAESFTFFDFSAQAGSLPGAVYLPTVTTDATGNPIYNFNIAVQPGVTYTVDPDVAVGYDFATGLGDPGFASVLLPSVGDGIYDLNLFDSIGNAFDTGIDIVAGDVFSFTSAAFVQEMLALGVMIDPALGVSRFGIRGIETSALLDPSNTQAFATGLTFVAAGNFTGTQTPIVAEVQVPEPGTLSLFGAGLLGLAALRRRRAA
jgi:hypothetical protein